MQTSTTLLAMIFAFPIGELLTKKTKRGRWGSAKMTVKLTISLLMTAKDNVQDKVIMQKIMND